jgi:hypothetical protein
MNAPDNDAPGFWLNLHTLGIAQAKWVAAVDTALGGRGARFLFAWLLSPFATYGVAQRTNAAHQSLGSEIRVSALACFIFTGTPFMADRQKRSVQEYASMLPDPLTELYVMAMPSARRPGLRLGLLQGITGS